MTARPSGRWRSPRKTGPRLRVGEVGMLVLAGVAALLGRQASRAQQERSTWQRHLHHRVAQPLLAAERELSRGNAPAAQDLVEEAVGQSRLLLAPPSDPHRADLVARDAAAAAKRIWGADLRLEPLSPGTDLPQLNRRLRTLVHTAVLESLNNIARHQPGARARLGIRRQGGYLVVTVAAATDAQTPRNAPADPAPGPTAAPGTGLVNGMQRPGGFGLTQLRTDTRRAGGRLVTRFDPTSSVVSLALPLHPVARLLATPVRDGGDADEVAS